MQKAHKRAIIIALAIILLLGLMIILIFNNIVFCPAPISLKMQKRLVADFTQIVNQHTTNGFTHIWYSAGLSSENSRIYGEDNGYILFFISTHLIPMKYDGVLDIDGIRFINTRDFDFFAYKDGVFIDIMDAYNQGLISRETLLEALEYHNQCLEEKTRIFG